jgi:hypothetical protein
VWGPGPERIQLITYQVAAQQSGRSSEKFAQPDVFGAVYVAFTADGRHVVAAAEQPSTIRVYACPVCVPFADVIDLAASRLVEPMTPDERELYLGEPVV